MAKQVLGFTGLVRDDLARVADALEHIAYPQLIHEGDTCRICRQKKKPIRMMRPSTVMNDHGLLTREAQIRHAKMMAGPEEPVADMFRYRELNRESTEPSKTS